LSLRWFSSAHDCMWFNSRSLEDWFTAGTMRYVSSANLHKFVLMLMAQFFIEHNRADLDIKRDGEIKKDWRL